MVANNKYMKDYDKNKESSYLKYKDVNNLYGWAMPQKLPLNDFKWVEYISEFDESFLKSYDEENDEGYIFFKLIFSNQFSTQYSLLDIQYSIYMTFTMIYHFYLKE